VQELDEPYRRATGVGMPMFLLGSCLATGKGTTGEGGLNPDLR
jgi:hypothetical protein